MLNIGRYHPLCRYLMSWGWSTHCVILLGIQSLSSANCFDEKDMGVGKSVNAPEQQLQLPSARVKKKTKKKRNTSKSPWQKQPRAPALTAKTEDHAWLEIHDVLHIFLPRTCTIELELETITVQYLMVDRSDYCRVMPSSRDSMRTVSFHKNDFQISDIMISRAVMSWVTRTSRNKQTRRPDRVNGSEPQSTRTSDPPTVAKENINLSISATFVFSFTALSSPSHAFPTCFSSVAAAKFLATTVHTSTPVHSNV